MKTATNSVGDTTRLLIGLLVIAGFAAAIWYVATHRPETTTLPVETCRHNSIDCDLLQQLAMVTEVS